MKFQWSNFDQEFIVHVVYSDQTKKEHKPAKKTDDKDMLIPSMDKISPYPTKEFVDKYRTEIEKYVLRKHPEYIERIYRNQSSSKRKPRPTNYLGMLADLSSRPLTATLLTEYINALGTIGITYAGDRVASITKTLPVGWYAVVDEDGEDSSILVFEDQHKGYDNMLKDETEILTDRKMGAPEILKQYFNDFGMQLHQQDIENSKS